MQSNPHAVVLQNPPPQMREINHLHRFPLLNPNPNLNPNPPVPRISCIAPLINRPIPARSGTFRSLFSEISNFKFQIDLTFLCPRIRNPKSAFRNWLPPPGGPSKKRTYADLSGLQPHGTRTTPDNPANLAALNARRERGASLRERHGHLRTRLPLTFNFEFFILPFYWAHPPPLAPFIRDPHIFTHPAQSVK
jgi:hypothetical protein